MSQAVRHVDRRVLQWFSARMSSHLLAALTGLSDSEPVCAAALINPTLCDFVSSSLFLPFLLFFPLLHFSNYSLTRLIFSNFFMLFLKGLVNQKKLILSLFTQPLVVPNPYIVILSATQKETI